MSTFIKVQAASIIGSAADYLMTILLVEVFQTWYLTANATGNISGFILQFVLLRYWVFKKESGSIQKQLPRYVIVFVGNLLLSAAGVYLITRFLHINYIISKTIVSILLGVSYNYYMQKKFVFCC
jgi:putative flippase GtrA